MISCDAAVVGAGPAGCSAAIRLARRGLGVVLVDKAAFPRPKPCGEGIMPEGVPHLDELGVLEEVEREGRRFHGVRYTSRRGASATGSFAAGRYGITARRETLDAALLRKARSCPGLRVLEGVPAAPWLKGGAVRGLVLPRGRVRAGVTLFADGASSSCARALGLRRLAPARRRFGLRARLEDVEGLERVVEVFFIEGGELYLVPQGGGRALIALLLEESAMARFAAGPREEAFLRTVRSCAFLAARTRRARLQGPVGGAGPLGGRAERCRGPGWLLVGDAAAGVDPVTGDGISLALEGGRLAASAALGETAAYDRGRRRMLRAKRPLERLLLTASRRPWLAELLLAGLARSPRAFTALLSV